MSPPHWEYFLSIESDLERCSRFVEFAPNNYSTYSVEFARVIMAAASEFDTLAKKLCKLINSSEQSDKITDYYPIITAKYPNFTDYEISIPRYTQLLSFKPWKDWDSSKRPDWWSKGYNKIKHERDQHFKKANLENAILATSGLLTGILYFYDCDSSNHTIDSSQAPKLLVPQNNNQSGFQSASTSWSYTVL